MIESFKRKRINIFGIKISYKEQINTSKNYKNIKRKLKRKIRHKEKIRVIFLIRETSKWSYDDLYKKMEKSDIFEPIIAVSLLTTAVFGIDKTRNNIEEIYNFFKNLKYNVVYAFDRNNNDFVDLQTLNPDMVFYDQPYELPEKHSPICVSEYALTYFQNYSYALFNYENDYAQNFHKFLYKYFVENQMNVERYERYQKGNSENCTVVGYSKLDKYQDNNTIDPQNIWKDSTKTKIIYAPHHSFEETGLRTATFRENGEFILNLAKQHPETTWIFKPHPRFKFALLQNNIMNEKEIEKYYEEWAEIGKIYESGNYFDIFKSSDLMITDCCSFRIEYLPTKNPIITPINENSLDFNDIGKQINEICYKTHSNEELEKIFAEIIIKKNDYLKEKRIKTISEIVKEENVSEKIIENIIRDIKK